MKKVEETKEIKGIYNKLLHIQQSIIGLGKDKAAYGYKYVTGDKLLEHVKPLMNELGILLKQEVLDFNNTRQDYTAKSGPKSEILTKVNMRFTWIDCETGEKDENLWGANGMNDWDKGMGSALTYGERYFLLKFFHIATDEDDIDNPDRKEGNKEVAPTQPQEPPPPTDKPVLVKDSKKYNTILQGLYEGAATWERIRLKNTVSDELQKEMDDAVAKMKADAMTTKKP